MSLTSLLDDPRSPVSQYLESRIPLIAATKRGAPFATQIQHLLGLDQVPRTVAHAPLSRPGARPVVGTAVDYRVRYYFAITPLRELVAAQGAAKLAPLQGLDLPDGPLFYDGVFRDPATLPAAIGEPVAQLANLAPEFFRALHRTLGDLQPIGRHLNPQEEELLDRYCLVLAFFETLFRAGILIDSPLYHLSPHATVADLLALPEHDLVDDLRLLAWECYDDAMRLMTRPMTLNPTFTGSRDVGGADGDLIVDDCLIELKTFASIEMKAIRDCLYQLLGYTLLDYDDHHHIRRVGIWMTRQQSIRTFGLQDLLFSPEDAVNRVSHTEAEIEERLAELRTEFRGLLVRSYLRRVRT